MEVNSRESLVKKTQDKGSWNRFMKLCILIPAYHEEGRIGRVAAQALQFGDVVVVDDGSKDQTAEEARAQGAHVICHSTNQGKGAAIQTGFDFFLPKAWDALILMDGDAQHDPKEIPKFIEASLDPSTAMVVGNRMTGTGAMPFIRVATNWVMSKILSLFAGVNVPDSQCGFRLMKRELIEKIKLKSKRFDVESEILIQAAQYKGGIRSVPIASIYGNEKSKIKPLRDTLRFLKLMIKALVNRHGWFERLGKKK